MSVLVNRDVEESSDRRRDLQARTSPTRLELDDGALVQPESARKLGLRQACPAPGRSQALRQPAAGWLGVEPQDPGQPTMVSGEWSGLAQLPEMNGLFAHPEALGKGPLRQAEVEAPAAKAITQRAHLARVTPWQ